MQTVRTYTCLKYLWFFPLLSYHLTSVSRYSFIPPPHLHLHSFHPLLIFLPSVTQTDTNDNIKWAPYHQPHLFSAPLALQCFTSLHSAFSFLSSHIWHNFLLFFSLTFPSLSYLQFPSLSFFFSCLFFSSPLLPTLLFYFAHLSSLFLFSRLFYQLFWRRTVCIKWALPVN